MKWQPFIFLMIVSLASCSKTPDYVISENDMAMLLADIHEADAVVTFDKQHYKEDSTKEVLCESIFAKHGVSEEQFDTSLIWYGHNLDVYTEVYDNVVEILKDRQKRIIAEAKEAGEKMTLSGDSVDIWASTPHIIFDRKRLGKDAQIAFYSLFLLTITARPATAMNGGSYYIMRQKKGMHLLPLIMTTGLLNIIHRTSSLMKLQS